MAIVARRSPSAAVSSPQTDPVVLRVYASSPLRERAWNFLPLAVSLLLASFVFWGHFTRPGPSPSSDGLLLYWLVRSYSVAISCLVGLRRIKQWQQTNWLAKYANGCRRTRTPRSGSGRATSS